MKNFIKKYMLKTLSCVALVCAVIFSCLIGTNKPLNNQNEMTEAAAAYADVSDLVSSISTVDASYSLMDEYPISPENQTTSGLCWAYSSSKALETALMVQAGEYFNFSEIAVSYLGFYNGFEYTPSFDTGGNIYMYEYIAERYGLVFESDFSNDKYFDMTTENYRNYDYVLNYASTEIMDSVDAVYFSVDTDYKNNTVAAKQAMIKKFIANYGGVYVGIEAGSIYKEGSKWIYTTDVAFEGDKWELGGAHAVCLVGYDANGFIALNSWGSGSSIPYLFYIPYCDTANETCTLHSKTKYCFAADAYTEFLDTAAGFVYDGSLNVEFASTSAETFDDLTGYNPVKNVFSYGETVEFTLSFDASINFTSVYVDAYKGTQEVSNAFHFDYNDTARTVKITLNTGVIAFEGGAYTFRVYESSQLLAQKAILIVSGTEITYFSLAIDGLAIEPYEHFLSSYLPSNESITYYVRGNNNYTITFNLTEMNKFKLSQMNKLKVSCSQPKVISVSGGVESVTDATLLNLNLQNTDGNQTANEYTISIQSLSNYKGKIIRIPLTIHSNISGITANRKYYINLVVSNKIDANADTPYAIEYVLNGGLNSYENIDRVPVYASDSPMTEFILREPTKMGETFVGWYLDKDFTTEITKISSAITSDVVLYAKWEENLVDYFDMSATISAITDHAGASKPLGGDVIYGDDLNFEITFAPEAVLSGYNYIVRYYFYLDGQEVANEQIDKVLLKSNVLLEFLEVGEYQVRVVVSVVISHNTSSTEERFINFEIKQKSVEFEFSNLNYTYDKQSHMPTIELVAGSVYAEDIAAFDWTVSKTAQTNAGTHKFEILSINNDNYVISGTNFCDMVIAPKEIEIVWDSTSAYYNKQKQIPSYTLSGILPGDSASIKELSLQTMIEAGVYDIEIAADSVTNPNYIIANTDDITFEIKPAEIVLTFKNVSCRVSLDAHNRPQITDKDYSIQGIVYQGDSLNLEIVCDALKPSATEIGEYDITATYSNPNYNVTIVKGIYKLLGSYTVKYSLPNGETYIEEVTEGEDPIGITQDIYKAGFFKKLVYSQELKNDNGQDLNIVVTEDWDVKVIAICGGAVAVACVLLYLIVTRKARRNKVR